MTTIDDLISAEAEQAKGWWESLERTTGEAFGKTASLMQRKVGVAPFFDEVALMVGTALDEYLLLESAARIGGWHLTNAAFDHVHTSPIPSQYDVHYSFLTKPDKEWRIEVMRLMGGVSPLHQSIPPGGITAVHHSFKVPDAEFYAEVVGLLRKAEWERAMTCESTYGRFSYWLPSQDDAPNEAGVFIKPRVNLRDSLTSETGTHVTADDSAPNADGPA